MYPVLAAVASTTRHIRIGSLVARVGLVPDQLIVESFLGLHEVSGHRVVAALGVGDAKSFSENEAYGSHGRVGGSTNVVGRRPRPAHWQRS